MKKQKMDSLNNKIANEFPQDKLLFGYGKLDSTIILIGEAPGSNEIKFNEPFVGQAGKHLNEFLETVNINRKDLYITNVVKYRPTKVNSETKRLSNRTPTIKEIDSFREYLYEEISIIDPNIIVSLGNIPLRGIFNKELKIGDTHGELLEKGLNNKSYAVFPLYHPAAIIYRPELKGIYMEDLISLKNIIKTLK